MPGFLVLAPDHEPGDVLEEDERDAALAGELDEVGALERRLAEQDPVVGDDRDGVATDVGEAGHQGLAVERLEVVEPRAVDEPGDDLADRHGAARVGRDRAVQPGGDAPGRPPGPPARARSQGSSGPRRWRLATIDRPSASGVLVVERLVVGDTGAAGMDLGATEVLGRHVLAGRRLHQRRPAKEDRPGAADDDRLVTHRRDVRATGRATSP